MEPRAFSFELRGGSRRGARAAHGFHYFGSLSFNHRQLRPICRQLVREVAIKALPSLKLWQRSPRIGQSPPLTSARIFSSRSIAARRRAACWASSRSRAFRDHRRARPTAPFSSWRRALKRRHAAADALHLARLFFALLRQMLARCKFFSTRSAWFQLRGARSQADRPAPARRARLRRRARARVSARVARVTLQARRRGRTRRSRA